MANKILTGIRSNNSLHIGNYLGAIKPMVDLQKSMKTDDQFFMFVPDLHSFTTPIEHSGLYESTLNNVRVFVACGVDPEHENTVLYRQSKISAHAELTWILNCFTYFGEASRMNEFKDKSDRLGHKSVSVGLFDYPVLMAADILLYAANFVPLGDDQKQHMELTRTIAQRFNAKFGDIFIVPEPWEKQLQFSKRDISVRIKSLSDPTKKMSKSVTDPSGTINLTDNPEQASAKVLRAQTDSVGVINLDWENQPGISNLLVLESQFGNRSLDDVCAQWSGKTNYGELKNSVAENIVIFLKDFQAKYKNVSQDSVESILENGEAVAKNIANDTLVKVKQAVGLTKK